MVDKRHWQTEKISFWDRFKPQWWGHVPQFVFFFGAVVLVVFGARSLFYDPDDIVTNKIGRTMYWGDGWKNNSKDCTSRDYTNYQFDLKDGRKISLWQPNCWMGKSHADRGHRLFLKRKYTEATKELLTSIEKKEAVKFSYHLLGAIGLARNNNKNGCHYYKKLCELGECVYFSFLQEKGTCEHSYIARVAKKREVQKSEKMTALKELEALARGEASKFIYDIN